MESIDALAKAVNEFEGGLVLVSHDMRLIGQVAKEIWICDNKTIEQYKGDILNFKMEMRAQMGIEGGLRGDASTIAKEADKAKEEKPKKPEPKLEVVAPPKPKPKPAVVDLEEVAPPPEPAPPLVTEPPAPAPAPAGEPPKNRYIPPHLRRKMQEQGSS
eukprot:scaffold18373_cov154-Amphora_coffeaeformis.AAC.5